VPWGLERVREGVAKVRECVKRCCEDARGCCEGARRCREGFGCRERVQEVIEGVGGRLYHRLLVGRRQERGMAYSVESRYWWKVGVGGSSRV
jgi:hypothetical protein